MRDAIVVAAGDKPGPLLGGRTAEIVVAVDGGVAALREAGIVPTLLVGDMDSSDDSDRVWAHDSGAQLVRHPVDKDQTDLELALAAAVSAGAGRLLVFGVEGGRDDHLLGNWAALCGVAGAAVEVRTATGTSHVVRESIRFDDLLPGDLVSVIPWGGVATGVTTAGLKWPLIGANLSPFAALGVSNVVVGSPVSVSVASGVLIVVRPTGDT